MFKWPVQGIGRIVSALAAGGRAAIDNFRGVEDRALIYDYLTYAGRTARYDEYERWYNNRAFDGLDLYRAKIRHQPIYKHIRSIYNPVHRLVDIETSKVYGGQIDWTGGLRVGAIPVVGASPRLIASIIQIFKWSNWGMEKDPFVRGGAKKGDRFLKIIDEVDRGRVRMEVLDPYKVTECDFDRVGNIKRIVIEEARLDENGEAYLQREQIDGQWFKYWRSYTADLFKDFDRRDPDEQYENKYGFVPVKHAPHVKEDDSPWGRTSFASSLGKIIEVNDQASLAHDATRKSLYPIWVATGRVPDADPESKKRDDMTVINVGKDGKVEAVTPTVNIEGTLGLIDRLLSEIENDTPQLSLQHIRDKAGVPSGTAIENSYSDASGLLTAIQGNCDEGTIGAMKMAISIAAYRRLPGFTAYDPITSYERGDLDFYIKPRDVFVDRVSKADRIRLLNESADKPTFPVVARDLEYTEEDIEEMELEKQASATAAMRGLAEAAFGQAGDTETEGEMAQLPQGEIDNGTQL